MSNPLVTALCLTKNRRQWLPKAIDCFLRQTYEPRELLIVISGESVDDLIPDDSRIRKLIAWAYPVPTIGKLRNAGCDQAHGELVAIWDDDDYSAPTRLETQIQRLEETGKAVHGWHSMKFTDGQNWWQYKGNASYALGTSLCFRRDWWKAHEFPDQQIGEDILFSTAAAAVGQLISEPDRDLMWASVHFGNTSPRPLTNQSYVPLPGYQWGKAA